jgi:lysozyme
MTTCIDLLKRHEGFKAKVYFCPAGKKTIGYGYNLDANPLSLKARVIAGFCKTGLCEAEAEQLLRDEVERLNELLSARLAFWPELNKARQAVLLNMAYNLGIEGLMKFTMTLKLIGRHDYTAAANAMLKSVWAQQVKGRATELAVIMKTGALR